MIKMHTVKEVAKILGRPETFVRLKIKNGQLKAISLGSVYRIEEQSLQDFLNQCKQENIEYSHSDIIDGITMQEFCKTINAGMSLARRLIKTLEKNNTIKVVKINNKTILPKDIYEKLGCIQDYGLESKGEPSTTTNTNTIRLFEDNTSHSPSNNHGEQPLTNIVESNDALSIIKELQQLNDMLKGGSITQDEFNTLKKALIRKV